MSAQIQASARPPIDDTNDRFAPFLMVLKQSLVANLSHHIGAHWEHPRARPWGWRG